MSTNTENLVKICHVLSEIFGEICPFCRVVQKLTDVTLVICAITGPIFVKFAQNVAKILRLNIFELECQVYHIPIRFGATVCRMKGSLQILPKISCHDNVP